MKISTDPAGNFLPENGRDLKSKPAGEETESLKQNQKNEITENPGRRYRQQLSQNGTGGCVSGTRRATGKLLITVGTS